MASGHKAHCTQNFQHCNLSLAVLCAQALCNGTDGLRLGQDVCPSLRVVHQSLDAANERRVDAALTRGVVHAPEEIQQAGQAFQLDEAGHKPRPEPKRSFLIVCFHTQFANSYSVCSPFTMLHPGNLLAHL